MNKTTLYDTAKQEMERIIKVYLNVSKTTAGFNNIKPEDLQESDVKKIILAGFSSSLADKTQEFNAKEVWAEWDRRKAIPFDIESAVSYTVYEKVRERASEIYDEIISSTNNFILLDDKLIVEHPYWLPLLQRMIGSFSKSSLKSEIGSVSDNHISLPAAKRLYEYIKARLDITTLNKKEVLRGLEATLEGIVRDLVGRILLESVIESALIEKNIKHKQESEYSVLKGVVYNFRADFVIPDEENPLVFIEVRKSSTRHASLYAKDKMFSAINWKGENQNLLGVIVVDGQWTAVTLKTMAKVFDYVVPINRVSELVDTIDAYLKGDKTKLKWLIEFKIMNAKK
jgi:hypothetical protein